jgi:hypothetical protein
LRAIIDATPSGHLTFLITELGKPFAVAGFGNWFREQCDTARVDREHQGWQAARARSNRRDALGGVA